MTKKQLFFDIEPFYKLIINDTNIEIISNSKHKKGKPLSQYLNSYGYLKVKLNNKNELVHRLIAKVCIPNPLNKQTVNHIDGNKLNNHPSNLEWVSIEENLKHSYDTGLHVAHNPQNHGNYKDGRAIKSKVNEYKKEWYQKNKTNILKKLKENYAQSKH